MHLRKSLCNQGRLSWGEGIRIRKQRRKRSDFGTSVLRYFGTRHGVRRSDSVRQSYSKSSYSKSTYPSPFGVPKQRGRWQFPRVLLYFKSFGDSEFYLQVLVIGRRRCARRAYVLSCLLTGRGSDQFIYLSTDLSELSAIASVF